MSIRYCAILPTYDINVFYSEDLKKYNIKDNPNQGIIFNEEYYISEKGIFLGVKLHRVQSNIILKNYNLIKEETTCNSNQNDDNNNSLSKGIICELKRIETKYDKKFNDLFENTSDIIKELKQDLDKKNEKLRELELKVHYLESQIEKKVTIDYEAIKKKNKTLNNEFKRVAKLMKLS